MKKIGILTSGGDAPGMNAAVRSVVRTAVSLGIEVVGIRKGYNGLIEGDFIPLDSRSVSDIINRGGTFLFTARSPKFKTEEGMARAIANCKEEGIEGIVVMGGDGSFRGALDLSNRGIPCVGIPCTIDNDIASTEYTIGFDTALNTAVEMIDRIRDTAQSHDRCSVVEVMGRNAGYIALYTGIAVGATAILIPEVRPDITSVISKIKKTQKNGKKHFIVILAEGVGGIKDIAEKIERETGIVTKTTILGHVQRGGAPTLRDRLIATKMGYKAVHLLNQGVGNRVVCMRGGDIVDEDITTALEMRKPFDFDLIKIAEEVSI
ncbi:MAG: 6-phosphofructokinase [Ruminococcaceae bacterium]|nr:6-phosphofructokinase [Oscillospiraceae bacterium]